MITELHLENFKGFAGRHSIPLNRVTLLYGPNSGGKSSVIQAVRMLPPRTDVGVNNILHLNLEGPEGWRFNFADVVNGKDLSKDLGLGFSRTCPDGSAMRIERLYEALPESERPEEAIDNVLKKLTFWPAGDGEPEIVFGRCQERLGALTLMKSRQYYRQQISGLVATSKAPLEAILFSSLFTWGGLDSATESPSNLCLFQLENNIARRDFMRQFVQPALEIGAFRIAVELGQFTFIDSHMDAALARVRTLLPTHIFMPGNMSSTLDIVPPESRNPPGSQFLYDALAKTALADCIKKFNHLHKMDMQYLGPHRPRALGYVNPAFDDGADILTGRYFRQDHGVDDGVSAMANALLGAMGLPLQLLTFDQANKNSGTRELLFRDTRSGIVHKASELGYGVSQIVPIVIGAVKGWMSPSIMCIEQPELHLHPRLQAELGELFEYPEDYNELRKKAFGDWGGDPSMLATMDTSPQWIVETHSEALLLRIQRRIREGRVSHKDINVLYIDNLDGEGSICTQLRLNENGDFIDEWPGGFFEDDFDEIFDWGSE